MSNRIFILHLILAVFFVLFFKSFFASWPVQTALIIVVILAIFANAKISFFWAIILGILLDGNSLWPTSILLIALLVTSWLVVFLSRNLIASRSLYSLLILVPFGTLVFEFVGVGLAWVLKLFNFNPHFFLPSVSYVIWTVIGNTLTGVAIFIVMHLLSNKFKSRFLTRW